MLVLSVNPWLCRELSVDLLVLKPLVEFLVKQCEHVDAEVDVNQLRLTANDQAVRISAQIFVDVFLAFRV